jgi:8-oxo-dGTP pyrophosphatase MutT (NUDIX family)
MDQQQQTQPQKQQQHHHKHAKSRVMLQYYNGRITEAPFDTSIFRFFDLPADVFCFTCDVAVHLTEKKIILLHNNRDVSSDQELLSLGYQIFKAKPLGRALKCPMFDFHLWPSAERLRVMNELNIARMNRNQPVLKHCSLAVSVLIENVKTGRVLITRRAKHMRSFPCVWVTPGGSIDEEDESLVATAQREVLEETGLTVEQNEISLFCMWESVFPHYLSIGPPTHHHVILYYKALVSLKEETIQMQVEEVDAYAWLDPSFVEQLLKQEREGTFKAFEQICSETTNSVTIHEREFHISRLNDIDALERVSEGTNFALAQWYKQKSGNISPLAQLDQ